jgi:Leucine-rich repeat (LRR) protein
LKDLSVRTDPVSSADRHATEGLTADPPIHSLSRHFPTFYFLWKCLISFRNGVWRRRRAIAVATVVAALSLVVLYGCWEYVVAPQRDAVAAIKRAGGSVVFDWEWTNGGPAPAGAEPPWPRWLVKALGRDAFGHVVVVNLYVSHAGDALFTHIGRLTHLERLTLSATTLKSTGLAQLENLTALEMLALPSHRFSDDDLAHLARMTKLKQLTLIGPQITNKGLAHLAGMRQMDSLQVVNTNITTLEPIRGLTPLRGLQLQGAPITDEGLEPLEGFTSLQWLSLGGSQVTDAGIAHFSTLSNLMKLDLTRTRVGDAGTRLLFDLPRIMWLNLYDTRVTDAGLANLADRLNRAPLQSLFVSGPGVTSGGLAELRKKLIRASVVGPDHVVYPPAGRAPPPASADDEELPR